MANQLQHYVPRMLLKNFTRNKKRQIFAFDKKLGKTFKSSIASIAAERNFYDYEKDDLRISIEDDLQRIESSAAPVLKKLIEAKNLNVINHSERECLATFIAAQILRTNMHRRFYMTMHTKRIESFTTMGATPSQIRAAGITTDPEKHKISILRSTMPMTAEVTPELLNKDWALVTTTKKSPFYISDHPVALDNSTNREKPQGLGLAVQGIEIYFPVTQTLLMHLMCPSITDQLGEAAKSIRRLDKCLPGFADQIMSNPIETRATINAIEKGIPTLASAAHVARANSLQVVSSTRFIFSATDDFRLVQDMLSSHPKVGNGPQVSFN